MRKLSVITSTCVLFIAGITLIAAPWSSGPASSNPTTPPRPAAGRPADLTGKGYEPLTPARVLDTRPGNPTVDGQHAGDGPIGAGLTHVLPLAGRGGVPASGAGAVSINVTVTGGSATSHLTVFPTGEAQPTASNLNFAAGQTIANMAVAKLGAGGSITIFNNSGNVDVIVDVVGWFVAGSHYTPLSPARVLDTRPGNPTVDGQHAGDGPIAGGTTHDLPLLGRGGVPAAGVDAVTINITVTGGSAASHLTLYPTGEAQPTASNLNFAAGQTIANMAISKLGAGGSITIFNNSGSVDVIVDVVGWVPTPAAAVPAIPPGMPAQYTPLSPARIYDSRPASPTIDGLHAGTGAIGPGGSYTLPVLGRGGVPANGVGGVAINVTVTGGSSTSHLTVYPAGATKPTASNLNFTAGQTIPNMAIAKLGTGGSITIFNNSGAVHVIVDVVGWVPTGTNQMDPATVLADEGTDLTVVALDRTGTSTFTYTGAGPIGVGSVLVVELSDGPYYGIVTSVNGTTITTNATSLAKVYPSLDLTMSAAGDTGAVNTSAPGGAPLAVTFPSGGGTAGAKSVQAVDGSCTGSVTVPITVNLSAQVGTFDLNARWGWTGPTYLKMAYHPIFTASATVGFSASGSCSFTAPLFSYNLPTIKFFVGPVPVWITQSVSATVNASASAQASMSVTVGYVAEGEIGAEWNDGSGFTLVRSLSGHKILDPAMDASATANVEMPFSYEALGYGIIGFSASTGPFAELNITPLSNPQLTLDAGIKGQLDALFKFDLGFTDLSQSHTFGPMEFARWRILTIGTGPGSSTSSSTSSTI